MNVNQVAQMGTRMEQAKQGGDMQVAVLKKAMDQTKVQGEAALKLIQTVDAVPPQFVDRVG